MTDTSGACPPPDARWPVGFIGVGNMGGALLQRLCALGWPVQAHDLDAERCAAAAAAGATLQPSPAAVAAHCRSLLVVVVDAAQCEAVLFGEQGAAATLAPGSVVLCCPTLGPQDVADAAARLARQGVSLIDAPMSGGPQRARDGQMSLMLAGAAAVLEAQQPLLAALAGARFVISERPGDAARTKLVNNLLAAVNLAGAAEALALAQALGLQGRRTLAVIAASSGQSWIGQDRLQRALDGDFAPRAHTRLLAKDSRLALAAARDAGLPAPPLGQLAQQTFAQACSRGLAEFDDASLLLLGGGRAEPAQATPPAVPEELTAALAEEAEVLASCAALARRLGLGEVIPRIIGRHSNLAVHLSPLPLVARVATGTARWRAIWMPGRPRTSRTTMAPTSMPNAARW